ncbi:hypothetical protein D3C80_978970 [compost metagenome]
MSALRATQSFTPPRESDFFQERTQGPLLMLWTALQPTGGVRPPAELEESHGTGSHDWFGHREVGVSGARRRC